MIEVSERTVKRYEGVIGEEDTAFCARVFEPVMGRQKKENPKHA
jgi:hypothetical protein